MEEQSPVRFGDSLKHPRLHGSSRDDGDDVMEEGNKIIISAGSAQRPNRAQ